MKRTVTSLLCLSTLGVAIPAALGASEPNVPPKGFNALFNGKDLTGWRGLGHTNPYEMAKWTADERKEKQQAADEDMKKHWKVENGEIINDGHGVFLTTDRDYRNFELWVDWRMMVPEADSGIYLRACPQVQIWNPDNKAAWPHGADKGSGALWNNNAAEGKFPLVKADRPVGEWNTFKITMIGERVTVTFNDKLVVDDAVMENFWDRAKPMVPAGPIQLQTHGGEMRFRNVFVREIPAEEANKILQQRDDKGFEPLFNGKDLSGWVRGEKSTTIEDGILKFKKGAGETVLTEKEYADFAVRFEFKLPPAGNNGLIIRSPLEGNGAFVGMEIQILDDTDPKYASLKDWQVHGSIYGVVPAHRGYLRPVGEWNYEEVIARGPHIQVIVNGTKIVDVDLSKIDKPLDDRDHPGMRRASGHVGFMGHSDPVELRNIRLKVLK